jgi:predicted AAA+ superfamily ATPase
MFKRQLLSTLEQWSKGSNRKPLVLRGARQVGKTTLVKEFAQSFDRFLYLNLELSEHKRIFEADYSFQELLSAIFYFTDSIRDQKRTLIFIDEIQNSPKAVASLRYFYENAPTLYVIAAGSLLESLIDSHISFPVGRVEYLTVRPCTFMEYLVAINDKQSIDILSQDHVPGFAHGKILSRFNQYALIGGMPEVVSSYAESKDLITINQIYSGLLISYSDDVEKYARNSNMAHHIRHIIKIGMSYAGQRIKFERFGSSDYRSREMGEAFRLLEKAMLLELTYPSVSPIIPVIPDFKKSPRLSWLDTGLVNYAAGIQKEVFGAKDISNAWRGILAEHITGQEILALDNSVLNRKAFWVREAKNSNAEVDYIYQFNGNVIPIEVKSSIGSRLKSLQLFMETAPHNIAVRVWSEPLSIDQIESSTGRKITLINIPFYLVNQLPQILHQYL